MTQSTQTITPVVPGNFRYAAQNADTPTARAFYARRVEAILNPPKVTRAPRKRRPTVKAADKEV